MYCTSLRELQLLLFQHPSSVLLFKIDEKMDREGSKKNGRKELRSKEKMRERRRERKGGRNEGTVKRAGVGC